jgi:2-oxoisovalerate dehydrogenase E2 component (dihydrolipoyl transacylase)
VVKELLVPEGQVAKVGQALCTIEVEDSSAATVDDQLAEPVKDEESAVPQDQAIEAELFKPPSRDEVVAAAAEVSRDVGGPSRRPHPLDPNQPPPTNMPSTRDVLATPAVRHFARSKGVDLAQVAPGGGKDGRVEKKDVEAFLAGHVDGFNSTAPSSTVTQTQEEMVVDLGRTRYGMWKAMEKSLAIPHFGYTTSLDLTRIHALLPHLNTAIPKHYLPPSPTTDRSRPPLVNPSALCPAPSAPDVPEHARFSKLTYLPFLLKTLSKAMHPWPLFRSSLTPSTADAKPSLTVRPHADIALALSTPSGLYTPVLRAVDSHSIFSLASRIHDIAHRGRQSPSALIPADMPKAGATLSVSNIGPVGAGEAAMPVLVPGGGVAIVALGRARWSLEVDSQHGEPARRLRMPVSWAADHRVVEGAELAAFVEEWRGWVEHPERMIVEGV